MSWVHYSSFQWKYRPTRIDRVMVALGMALWSAERAEALARRKHCTAARRDKLERRADLYRRSAESMAKELQR